MALRLRKNQYQGVNAHLQSFLQQPHGGWETFHYKFISFLSDEIDRNLPSSYYATVEKSLQIKTEIEPDVLIAYRPGPEETLPVPGISQTQAQVMVFPEELVEMDTSEYYPAILIYGDDSEDTPVTRIEILSPANKPPAGSYHRIYESKRAETLSAMVNLVEIDLLHETPPIVSLRYYVKNYAVRKNEVRHATAKAYHVAVTQPLRLEERGVISRISIYSFNVDEPMPVVEIPLKGEEKVLIDSGAAYNTTFESLRVFFRNVDYSQIPPGFDKYSLSDGQRIQNRMQAVQELAQKGLLDE